MEQLCRTWRLILEEREALSKSAEGEDKVAQAASRRLQRVNQALVAYLDAQRGKDRLSDIVDQWCGRRLVEALQAAEELVTAILGYVAGTTRHRKRGTALRTVHPGGKAVLRMLKPRELLSAHREECDQFVRVVGVSRRALLAALRDPRVQVAFKVDGERTAALKLLQVFGYGSPATSYRKLRRYAIASTDGIITVRKTRSGPRPNEKSRRPASHSRKTGCS